MAEEELRQPGNRRLQNGSPRSGLRVAGKSIRAIAQLLAAVSAIVVMASDNTVTFASCRYRIIGTAIGALLGWVTFYAWLMASQDECLISFLPGSPR